MSKFTNRLSRLHQSRVRALDHADERPNGVYEADLVVPPQTRPLQLDCSWTKAGALGPALHFVTRHREAIGTITLDQARCALPVGWSNQTTLLADIAHERLAFFDIETTGLGNDAISFCLGLAYWSGDELEITQWILEDLAYERRTLDSLAVALERFDAIVTFNGASFDLPRVAARMAHHNVPSPFDRLVHVDLLQVARRLLPRQPMSLPDLEQKVLGIHRRGDIPGAEAPVRWNTYVRTGLVHGLLPLFTHNTQDVISLVALNAAFVRILRPDVVHQAQQTQPGGSLADQAQQTQSGGSLADHAQQTQPGGSLADPAQQTQPGGSLADQAQQTQPGGSLADQAQQTQPGGSLADQSNSMHEKLEKVYRLRSGRSVRAQPTVPRPTIPSTANHLGDRLQTLRLEAMRLIQAGRSDDALPLLHEMVALSPANPFPLAELARYYVANAEPEMARIFESRLKGLGLHL